MIVRSNLIALQAQHQLRKNDTRMQQTIAKLSSGLRITKSADDAAGLAISTRMTSQYRGSQKAISNLNDAIEMLQSAESGASNINDLLQRAHELILLAKNGTYSDSDKRSLNIEFQQILNQITTVAKGTTYNSTQVLYGSGLVKDNNPMLDELEQKIPYWVDDAVKNIQQNLGIPVPNNLNLKIRLYKNESDYRSTTLYSEDGSRVISINLSKFLDENEQVIQNSSGGKLDTAIAHEINHVMLSNIMKKPTPRNQYWFIEGISAVTAGMNSTYPNGNYRANLVIPEEDLNWGHSYSYLGIKTLHEITVGGIQAFIDRLKAGDSVDEAFQHTTQKNQGEFSSGSVPNFSSSQEYLKWFNTSTDVDNYLKNSSDFTSGEGAVLPGAGNSNSASLEDAIQNDNTIDFPNAFQLKIDRSLSQVNIHSDTTAEDIMTFTLQDFTAIGLHITGNINDPSTGIVNDLLSRVQKAISIVSGVRGYYGSMINQFSIQKENLASSSLNIVEAKSRIQDADMAQEQSELVKQKILTQSTIAMLVQGQALPETFLPLLK